MKKLLYSCAAIFAAFATQAIAAETANPSVLDMSLNDLGGIEITSVSKKAEKATEAAAAIYVITQEDIRRSGMTSIPELLRMVPGLNVAQSASHQWAVSARGHNAQFANKLLVLMDGRTIYTPVFSGVIWDVQDTLLEDIERIEVIRGPGATLWGANAVNGVINIITKNAADTQGNYASFSTGNYERGIVSARHGGKLEDTNWRAYLKHNSREALERTNGLSASDAWRKSQAGFRADSAIGESADLTVQGDLYYSRESFILNLPDFNAAALSVPTHDSTQQSGVNLLARYHRSLSDISDITFQTYYDMAARDIAYYHDKIHTLDFDFQHQWRGWERNDVIWGVGYRMVYMDSQDTPYQSFQPRSRADNLFSAFLQDEITLMKDELFLTLGSKFEHNEYSGFELQPSARLSWLLAEDQTLWGSVARAVRTPYRYTDDAHLKLAAFSVPANGFVDSEPNRDLDSEEMLAYEMGYRFKPHERVSMDLATFYNDYDKLFFTTLGTPAVAVDPLFGAYLSVPSMISNGNEGRSYGFEAATNIDLAANWQIAGSYSYIDLKFKRADIGFAVAGRQPRHQFNIRSTYKFPYDIEMTNALYYVDELKGISIPSYYRFDTRIAWAPHDGVELSLVGQNLLEPHHPEFNGFFYQNSAEVGRSVYASATFRF